MKFTTSLFAIVAALASFAAAKPALDVRATADPGVLYPHSGTVWASKSHHNITWVTSSSSGSSGSGFCTQSKRATDNTLLVLAKNGVVVSGTGGYKYPLAKDFSLTSGRIEVAVPSVGGTSSKYQVILFADTSDSTDSGAYSAQFTIDK